MKPRKNIALMLLLITVQTRLFAQEIDLKNIQYEISAEFFPGNANYFQYSAPSDGYMRAHSNIEFETSRKENLTFYLHGEFWIDSILCNETKVDFKQEKVFYPFDYCNIALKADLNLSNTGEPVNLDVFYSGYFNPSKARSISDFMKADKQDGVLLRGYGYSLWFPVFTSGSQNIYEAAFKKVVIKTPSDFRTVVTGKLISENVENGINTSVWNPGMVNIMNIQCISRKYQIKSDGTTHVYYLNDTQSIENSEKILDFVIKLKSFYSSYLLKANNPDELYILEMPKYGDISGGNIIGIQKDRFSLSDFWNKVTIAHELIHPYVQIPVKTDNPFYAFVIEGFPGFFDFWALCSILNKDEFDIKKYMSWLESEYLKKKETGKGARGRKLPAEKPILKISPDEIGAYKDVFILNDRVSLFFYHIWNKMGDERFDNFIRDLFNQNTISYQSFESIILNYIPEYKNDLNLWLNTTEFPERFRIN